MTKIAIVYFSSSKGNTETVANDLYYSSLIDAANLQRAKIA